MAFTEVAASSISNVNIAGPGFTTLDGVTLANPSRILLTAQLTPSQNGVWLYNGSGNALTRPGTPDQFDAGNSFDNATIVWVKGGSARGGTVWGIDPAAVVTIDTTGFELTRVSLPPVQCRAATTGNISIGGTHTEIDGVTLVGNGAAGSDIVLVKDQSDPTKNGLWWANTGGAMNRCSEPLVPGRAVVVVGGNSNAHSRFELTTGGPIVPGTTSLEFALQTLAINPLDYGAKFDGVTNDRDALQDAFNAAAPINSSPSGTITVDAANKRYTRSDAGSFRYVEGILPRMKIYVDGGFANAANKGWKTVTASTDAYIEVAETCVNETTAAGVATFRKDGVGTVVLPAGTCLVGSTVFAPLRVSIRGQGRAETTIQASEALTDVVLLQSGLKNSGGEGLCEYADFAIRGNGTTDIGFYSYNGFFTTFSRILVGGCVDGLVIDQSEVVNVTAYYGEHNSRAQIWIVNGADVTAGTSGGFSNVINLRDCQLVGGEYGLVDDGGDVRRVDGCNIAGSSVAGIRIAGLSMGKITGCYVEVSGDGILFTNTTLEDGTGTHAALLVEVEKCLFNQPIAIAAADDVVLNQCEIQSTPTDTAITGVGNATRLEVRDCLDLGGYGMVDGIPLIGTLSPSGGPERYTLVRNDYRAPTIGNARVTTLCWNGLPSNKPITSGSITMSVGTDTDGFWMYTRTAGGSGNFHTDGFRDGMVVEMRGFASGSNNGPKTILAVSATTLKVVETGATASATASVSATFRPAPYMGFASVDGSVWQPFAPTVHQTFHVRGAVTVNESIGAFDSVAGGTIRDGVTYFEGDRVLLAGQTTYPEENGIYVVGEVSGGAAQLTRAVDLPNGTLLIDGATFEVAEGTLFGLTTWKITTSGPLVIGTDGWAAYPKTVRGSSALTAGTFTINCPVLSTSATLVGLVRTAVGGSVTSTVMYCPTTGSPPAVNGLTAGLAGSVTVEACDSTGSLANGDTSTLAWNVTNW